MHRTSGNHSDFSSTKSQREGDVEQSTLICFAKNMETPFRLKGHTVSF
jgi:hypothetical protein